MMHLGGRPMLGRLEWGDTHTNRFVFAKEIDWCAYRTSSNDLKRIFPTNLWFRPQSRLLPRESRGETMLGSQKMADVHTVRFVSTRGIDWCATLGVFQQLLQSYREKCFGNRSYCCGDQWENSREGTFFSTIFCVMKADVCGHLLSRFRFSCGSLDFLLQLVL